MGCKTKLVDFRPSLQGMMRLCGPCTLCIHTPTFACYSFASDVHGTSAVHEDGAACQTFDKNSLNSRCNTDSLCVSLAFLSMTCDLLLIWGHGKFARATLTEESRRAWPSDFFLQPSETPSICYSPERIMTYLLLLPRKASKCAKCGAWELCLVVIVLFLLALGGFLLGQIAALRVTLDTYVIVYTTQHNALSANAAIIQDKIADTENMLATADNMLASVEHKIACVVQGNGDENQANVHEQ